MRGSSGHRMVAGRLLVAMALVAGAVLGTMSLGGAEDTPPGHDEDHDHAHHEEALYTPGEYPESDLRAIAEQLGVSMESAHQRMEVEDAAILTQREATSRWPGDFAGLWLQPHGEPRLIVAFTTDAEARVDELRESFPYPELLDARTHAMALDELETIQAEMIADRNLLQTGLPPEWMPSELRSTDGVYDLDIDITTNNLVARFEEPTPTLEEALRARYAPNLAVKRGVAAPATGHCLRSNCHPIMRGGIEILTPTSTCSVGFAAVAASGTGNLYSTSAGHCGSAHEVAWNGGVRYGVVTMREVEGFVDVRRILRDSGSTWQNHGSVFHSYSPWEMRAMETTISWADTVVGTNLAKSGRTTGTTFGQVTSRNNSLQDVPNSSRFVAARFCAAGGDSGGAVYREFTAYGIQSAATLNLPCSDPDFRSYFGNVEYALSAMNLRLLRYSEGVQPPNTTTTTTAPTTTTSTSTTTTTTCLVKEPVTGICLVQ